MGVLDGVTGSRDPPADVVELIFRGREGGGRRGRERDETDEFVGDAHSEPPVGAGWVLATTPEKPASVSMVSSAVKIRTADPAPRTGSVSASTLASNSSSVSGRAKLPRACSTCTTTGSASRKRTV